MPIKKDGTGKRWVEMELITPGTPDEVWQAMATGPGNSAWFTSTTVDEHTGGTITFDFGAHGSQSGEVTRWDPPHHFGYVEREWSEGAPPVATEITITARSGNECVVRMVHSLFASTDDWDDQVEGFEKGWPVFFGILRLYLAHFAGRPAASFMVMNKIQGSDLAVWRRLTERLGLDHANAGEERATPAQPEMLFGVVESVRQDRQQRYVTMRLTAPAPGIALIGTYVAGTEVNASITLFLYGADAQERAAASEPKWREWIGEFWSRADRQEQVGAQ